LRQQPSTSLQETYHITPTNELSSRTQEYNTQPLLLLLVLVVVWLEVDQAHQQQQQEQGREKDLGKKWNCWMLVGDCWA
jgi:hypothetical protein